MRFGIIVLFFCVGAYQAEARVPNIVVQKAQSDIFFIEDPTLAQAFYGQLTDAPHTFQITVQEPITLSTQILLPDIASSKNNISGIIIKESPKGGRVIEITRLAAKSGVWNTVYEPVGGDTYLQGPAFEQVLDPGVYRLEVHTPDNEEKYVLHIGNRDEMTIGYFEHLKRILQIKLFFEKSHFAIIESMLVYIPLVILGGAGIIVWFIRRRKARQAVPQGSE